MSRGASREYAKPRCGSSEEDALDAGQAKPLQDGGQFFVAGLHQRHPVREGSQQAPGLVDGGGVGVDPDERQPGMRGQQRAGVAGPAEGGVHQNGAVRLEGGPEQREYAVLHDRQVTGRSRACRAHRAPFPLPYCASGEMPGQAPIRAMC